MPQNPKPEDADPLLLVLVGPTASGKTALALELAEHLGGEIVSCDSVAVYRGMDIGSAKPTPAEQARIPHHLVDVTTPATDYTAGDYSRAARAAIRSIAARGRTPIVAGGTGLYLRALLDGLSPMPTRDEALRTRLRRIAGRDTHSTAGSSVMTASAEGSAGQQGPELLRTAQRPRSATRLHRLLTRLDPIAAAAIHPNDEPKLIRALEVTLLARRPVTQAWQHQRPEPLTGFRVLQFGLAPPRAELYRRINARCAAMFHHGLVEETRTLLAQYGPDRRAFTALGYAQATALLEPGSPQARELATFVHTHSPKPTGPSRRVDGTGPNTGRHALPTEADAIASTQQGHRNYSKRQLTWFRRDPRIHWLPTFGEAALPQLHEALSRTSLP